MADSNKADPTDTSDSTRRAIQARFGPLSDQYVSSAVHSTGHTLERLLELVAPAPGKRALDVATGGGHVALGLARAGATTIASDLTTPMLNSARRFIQGEDIAASFVRCDAQRLPFSANSLDIVTCRLAAHHFPEVRQFVSECARVIRPWGVVGLADQIGPSKPQAAQFCNAYEKLRDPSHVWEYSRYEWEKYFSEAGLEIRAVEVSKSRLDFQWWVQMQHVDAESVMRLRIMLAQAPDAVAEWLEPQLDGDGGSFALWQIILIAAKAGA